MMSQQVAYIPLTSLDHAFYPIFGFWFFDSKLSIEKLQKSLDRVIERDLKVLSAKIVVPEGRERYHIEIVSPSNVQIIEEEIYEDLFNLYLPDPHGTLSHEEGKKLFKFIDNIEIIGFRAAKPKLGTPVLKIKLFHIANKSKSVLSVSVAHCIADAFSLASFMNTWGCEWNEEPEKRIVSKFNIERNIKPTENYDMYKDCNNPHMDILSDYHPMKKVLEEEIGFRMLKAEDCVNKLIHFSKSRLDDLKREANKIDSDYRISSNDCICAYLWKLHTIVTRKNVRSGVIPFKFVIDFRNMTPHASLGYFGNAVVTSCMDYSAEEVLKMSFAEATHKIRELLINTTKDPSLIQTCIDLKHYVISNDLTYLSNTFHRNTSYFMNDWRVFDRMRPSGCCRVEMYPPCMDVYPSQCSVVLMASHGEKGSLNARFTFEKEVFEKIKEMDLSSLKTLEELIENDMF